MGVLLQAFFRIGSAGVPSPFDTDRDDVPWWWDHLAAQALELRRAGFTAVWLPPVWKGSSGTFSVGYDVFDDYDLGSKNQMGSVPTRYGTREQLARCVATLRACGLDAYVDLVSNQRLGGQAMRYRYRASGGDQAGRFPKDPANFHPTVPQDPGVFGGRRAAEASFGDDLAIINGRPAGYVSKGLVDATGWMTHALDVQGYRLDDAKGVSTLFVPRLLGTAPMAGKFAVGEFFDGDTRLIREWIDSTGRRSSAFDFPLRFTLARMCNQGGGFDMGGSLDHAGLTGQDPMAAVTFVENHDTDTRPELQPVISNKMLAYAYILTSEGYPTVYYRDYSHDRNCYGLKPLIDNLIWIHEKLAFGPTQERWKEVGLFAFERLGGPHLLVALNKDDWQERVITVDTLFGPNVHLHDYTGHARDTFTDGNGRAIITVPRNRDGLGYCCFSRDGLGGGFEIVEHAARQELEGAFDLDIPPLGNDVPVVVGRIWVQRGKAMTFDLHKVEKKGFADATRVELSIEGPGGDVETKAVFAHGKTVKQTLHAGARGWHRLSLRAAGLPAEHPHAAFTLVVTYTAPRTLGGEG